MRTSVLIADGEERTRVILRTAFENAGLTVCAEASDGYDAVEKATELCPDVIILELRMPMLNGIEVASVLGQRLPRSKIILVSTYNVGESLVGVWGISAIVAKSEGLWKIVDSVRRLARTATTAPHMIPTPDEAQPASSR